MGTRMGHEIDSFDIYLQGSQSMQLTTQKWVDPMSSQALQLGTHLRSVFTWVQRWDRRSNILTSLSSDPKEGNPAIREWDPAIQGLDDPSNMHTSKSWRHVDWATRYRKFTSSNTGRRDGLQWLTNSRMQLGQTGCGSTPKLKTNVYTRGITLGRDRSQ